VRFLTPVYHPSIKKDSGEICADLIKSDWKPAMNIRSILVILQDMLKEPTAESPLEPEIAELLTNNPEEFAKKASEATKKYAC